MKQSPNMGNCMESNLEAKLASGYWVCPAEKTSFNLLHGLNYKVGKKTDISLRQMNLKGAVKQRKLIRKIGISSLTIISSIMQIAQGTINLIRFSPHV